MTRDFKNGFLGKDRPSCHPGLNEWNDGVDFRDAIKRSIDWAKKEGSYGTVHVKRMAIALEILMKEAKL